MSSCVLCGVESIEDDSVEGLVQKYENNHEIYNLIHLYLPFCDLNLNLDVAHLDLIHHPSPHVCAECTKELIQFHNFYTKIEEIYLHNNHDLECHETITLIEQNPSVNVIQDSENISTDITVEIIENVSEDQNNPQDSDYPKISSRRYRRTLDLSCDLCNEPLDSFASALTHHKLIHNQLGYLKCCNRKFKQNSLFFDHLELHENPKKFECQICLKKFSSNGNLKTHLNLHKFNRVYYFCDLCERKFTNKYKIVAHMKESHLESFKEFSCDKCKKKFSSKFRFENHKQCHEEVKSFCCEICGRELKTSTGLREHMKNTHSDNSERIECKLCGHFLKNPYSMRKHMNRHRQMEQNIQCKVCQKPCTTKAALSSHMRMKHLLQRTIPCQHCEKKFKQKIDRDEHESTHTGVDLYKCNFCDATFKFGANFRAHRKNVHPVEYEKIKPKWLRPN